MISRRQLLANTVIVATAAMIKLPEGMHAMDGGFNKYQINAKGQLVIQALLSPNFVSGVSGWEIRKDGSVEFNDGVFRGTIVNGGLFIYNGVPAFGNLVMAISPTGGTDAFGNHYEQGLSFPPNDGSHNIAELTQLGGTLTLLGPGDGTGAGVTQVNLYGNGSGKSGSLRIYSGSGAGAGADIELFADNGGEVFVNGLLKVAAGEPGAYYSEEKSLAGNIASGVTTTLTPGATNKIQSDYGSGWAGNLWTAPIDSWYTVSAAIGNIGSAGNRALIRIQLNGNRIWEDDKTCAASARCTTGGRKWLIAGDTIQAIAFQNTGGTQTMDAQSHITIAREI
jgi:hypothetical protein